jgi:hypothetical protein
MGRSSLGLLIAGGIAQWVCGVIVAVALVRRRPSDGISGHPPHAVALMALLFFVLAPIELFLATFGRRFGMRIVPELATDRWQVIVLLAVCGVAWVVLLIAGVMLGLMNVHVRRRTTAAELKRRTDRALGQR